MAAAAGLMCVLLIVHISFQQSTPLNPAMARLQAWSAPGVRLSAHTARDVKTWGSPTVQSPPAGTPEKVSNIDGVQSAPDWESQAGLVCAFLPSPTEASTRRSKPQPLPLDPTAGGRRGGRTWSADCSWSID